MFKALFNIIINMLASIIQIICWPINTLISSALPDLSNKITFVTNTIGTIFNSISWGLGLLPTAVVEALLFIVLVEIAMHTIYKSTHALVKVWNVLQKIKFW